MLLLLLVEVLSPIQHHRHHRFLNRHILLYRQKHQWGQNILVIHKLVEILTPGGIEKITMATLMTVSHTTMSRWKGGMIKGRMPWIVDERRSWVAYSVVTKQSKREKEMLGRKQKTRKGLKIPLSMRDQSRQRNQVTNHLCCHQICR